MKTMYEEIGVRLKSLREKAGISQKELSERCGWESQSRIGNYELGTRKISAEDAILISTQLDTTPAYLLFGQEGECKNETYDYPLLTKVQAGRFTAVDGCYTEKDAVRLVKSTKKASDKAFWLLVDGDSMTSPVGLSFPDGMLILVEPKYPVVAGDLIVAYLTEANEATFKKYIEDAGMKYLKPLNPNYPLIRIDGNCKVVGKVIDAKWEL